MVAAFPSSDTKVLNRIKHRGDNRIGTRGEILVSPRVHPQL